MALITVNGTAGGAGTPYALGTDDSLIVGPSGLVYSTTSNAITGSGSNQSVVVSGTVLSTSGDAIHLDTGGAGTGVTVTVAASGYLQGDDDCISVYASAANVENYGVLNGGYGVYIGSSLATVSTVFNAGTINASSIGVLGRGASSTHLINEGLISGDSASFYGLGAADIVDNSGVMRGNVTLSGGNDTYNGADGRVVGSIAGGSGNDTMVAGNSVDVMDGGAGVDTLDFRNSGAIRVALDASFGNTGAAAGDTYSGFEVLLGSAAGSDALTGNTLANTLRGLGGADTLSGGVGNDILVGGGRIDRLTGGAGADRFMFDAISHRGDIVTDFSNSGANDDAFRIAAAGFGAGLSAGVLAAAQFKSGANNLAGDANDRFIFRTTDKTLWFDANGSVAGGGPVLIADLQASATMTAADIIIF